MTIAIDIRPLLEREKTGVSFYTEELVKRLVADVNHRFILFYNSWQAEIPDVWQRPNVTVRRFRWPNRLLNFAIALFNEPYFDELIPEADYFLFPNLNFFRLKRKPYGVVVHDISFDLFPAFYKWKSRAWHRLIGIVSVLPAARHIFAVSKNTKEDLLALYTLPPEAVVVVYPGVAVNSPQGLPVNHEPYILFLARLEERKNILGMIDSFIQNKNDHALDKFSLVLAGPLDKNSSYGRKILARANGRSDIKITGYASAEEKISLLSGASMFVYPSFYEGFGFPPLEAQALGIPVIASNNSSLSEILGSSALLVDPYKQEDIAMAMKCLSANHNLREYYIKKGFINVQRFSWGKTIDQIKKIIMLDF